MCEHSDLVGAQKIFTEPASYVGDDLNDSISSMPVSNGPIAGAASPGARMLPTGLRGGPELQQQPKGTSRESRRKLAVRRPEVGR
ncbi:hypothetical protein ABZ746_38725 [Streptomyces sp. NPDC020096]